MSDNTGIQLRVWRQDSEASQGHWETFAVSGGMSVMDAICSVQQNPVLADGSGTTAVEWEATCGERCSGECSLLINGTPRQACVASLDEFDAEVVVEPLTSFPVVRDLMVDRARMEEELARIRAFNELGEAGDAFVVPAIPSEDQERMVAYSSCLFCGLCLEVCPEYHRESDFVGPLALSQVDLYNTHPTGKLRRSERLHAVMGRGGVADCGNAQNCVDACPQDIPLTSAIGRVNRDASRQWFKDLFQG